MSVQTRPRVFPVAIDQSSPSESASAGVRGIPWDVLVPRVTREVAASRPSELKEPIQILRITHPVDASSQQRHEQALVTSRSDGMTHEATAAFPGTSSADWAVLSQTRRGRPNLDGFAFHSLQSQRQQEPQEPSVLPSSSLSPSVPPSQTPLPQRDAEASATGPSPANVSPKTSPPRKPSAAVSASTRLRGPVATLSYYNSATQPYNQVSAPEREGQLLRLNEGNAKEDKTRVKESAEKTRRAASEHAITQRGAQRNGKSRKGESDEDGLEIEVEEILPELSVQSQSSSSCAAFSHPRSQQLLLRASDSPRHGLERRKTADDTSGDAGTRQQRRRSRPRRPTTYSRVASLSEGRPLYPHLREEQNLHTRGLLRLPTSSPAVRAMSCGVSRPLSKSETKQLDNRVAARRSVSTPAASSAPLRRSSQQQQQRTAQWVTRLLEDATHQVALQQQQQQQQQRRQRQGRGKSDASLLPLSSPISVAEVLTSFLVTRYGAIRWRPVLEEMAAGLHCFAQVCPLIAIIRRYFVAPAEKDVLDEEAEETGSWNNSSGSAATRGVRKGEIESYSASQALVDFCLFSLLKDMNARNSFVVRNRITIRSHRQYRYRQRQQQRPQSSPPMSALHDDESVDREGDSAAPHVVTTIATRRYFRLHNIAVELTAVLEALTIQEAVASFPWETKEHARRAEQHRKQSEGERAGASDGRQARFYYLPAKSSLGGGRFVTEEEGMSQCKLQPCFTTRPRRLRQVEIDSILDLVLAWINKGVASHGKAQAPRTIVRAPSEDWKDEEDNEERGDKGCLSMADDRLAFDREGCVDADATVQALVEAVNATCCVHVESARKDWERGVHTSGGTSTVSLNVRGEAEDSRENGRENAPPAATALMAPARGAVLSAHTFQHGSDDNDGAAAGTRLSTLKGNSPVTSQDQPLSFFGSRAARLAADARGDSASAQPQQSQFSLGKQREMEGETEAGRRPREKLWSRHSPASLTASSATSRLNGHRDADPDVQAAQHHHHTTISPPTRTATPAAARPQAPPLAQRRPLRYSAAGNARGVESGTDGKGVTPLPSPRGGSDADVDRRGGAATGGRREAARKVNGGSSGKKEERRKESSPYVLRHALHVDTSSQTHLSETIAALESDLRARKRERQQQQRRQMQQLQTLKAAVNDEVSGGLDVGTAEGKTHGRANVSPIGFSSSTRLAARLRTAGEEATKATHGATRGAAIAPPPPSLTAEEADALADLDSVLRLLKERRSRANPLP